MKLFICCVLLFTGCKNSLEKNTKTSIADTVIVATKVNSSNKNNSIVQKFTVDTLNQILPTHHLVLTSNALQIVNGSTGSTSEISFGKPLDELVAITNKILQEKVSGIGVNNECGAGLLKMAVWNNGLNLIFKEQKSNRLWQFVGWYLGKSANNTKPLQTMAGIGIGSTREEMETAYVIKVTKSSLGYEFSTTSGLYGIFDGPSKKAKITDIWSGTTCVFR